MLPVRIREMLTQVNAGRVLALVGHGFSGAGQSRLLCLGASRNKRDREFGDPIHLGDRAAVMVLDIDIGKSTTHGPLSSLLEPAFSRPTLTSQSAGLAPVIMAAHSLSEPRR